jgi:Ca2+-binding EF-hand superfamily protein
MAGLGFTKEQLLEFKAAFEKYDVNKDNAISLDEFKDACKGLGLKELSPTEVAEVVS